MGNIAKRPDGKWRARYRDAAGKEHAKHFDRKVEAERWLATVHVALLRGEWVDPALGRTTLGDWASTWSEGLGHLKPSTRARYVNIYEVHVRPRWGEVQLARITHGEIAAWLAERLGDGVAASTVR